MTTKTYRRRRPANVHPDTPRGVVPLGQPPFEEWTLLASCRGKTDNRDENGDDLWHPKKQKNAAHGKHICKTQCPVRGACLRHALANGIGQGTLGGMDEWERRELRKQIRGN